LAGNVNKDANKIEYEPNKGLFRKIAFDVFQLNSAPVESLWTLESSDDGTQYLVAMYADDDTETLEAKGDWNAIMCKNASSVTLTYKETPLYKFASSDYGFIESDAHIFQRSLIEKFSSDKAFVSLFLKAQPKNKLSEILNKFPELKDFV